VNNRTNEVGINLGLLIIMIVILNFLVSTKFESFM